MIIIGEMNAFRKPVNILITLYLFGSIFAGCKGSGEPVTVRRQRIKGNVRVAVINASGENGLARKVTLWLRDMGYDVLYFGSDTAVVKKTLVIDHIRRNKKYGKMVGGTIGCKNIVYEPDPDSLFDVTLIIGSDYRRFFQEAMRKNLIY